MDSSLFLMLFRLTMQSFLYWMVATLFLALAVYVVLYFFDRVRANTYRSLWRRVYYSAFIGFSVFGYLFGEFVLSDTWKLIGVALLIVAFDFGLMPSTDETEQKVEIEFEGDIKNRLTREP